MISGASAWNVAVRQGGEDQADAVQRRRLEPLDPRAGIGQSEMRMHVGQRRAGLAVAEQPGGAELRDAPAQSRSSSAPTKPEAPRMATSIIARHMQSTA